MDNEDAAVPLSVARDDNARLIGALIDLAISVAMLVGGIASIAGIQAAAGGQMPFLAAVLLIAYVWTLDVLLYAMPVHRWGWSIGNLLTRRRVVDARSGHLLSLSQSVRRYFARRNVLKWWWDNAKRDEARFDDRSFEHVAGVPLSLPAGLVALAVQGYAPADPTGPTESHADRRAGSVVVRS